MSKTIDLSKKTFFLITGASRGIGKTMAIECSRKFGPKSTVVLMARNEVGLQTTKNKILEVNPNINVYAYSIDLARPSAADLTKCLTDSLSTQNSTDFDLAFIIHNAATLGNISGGVSDIVDPVKWQDYLDMNVTSVAVLNAIFMKTFNNNRKFVVNVTSSAAITPFASMGQYCTGKAARQMMFKILAVEEPDTMVLNYSPGPVDTDMQTDIIEKSTCDSLKNTLSNLRKTNTSVTTEQTTAKFLKIIKNGSFSSGDYVHYND